MESSQGSQLSEQKKPSLYERYEIQILIVVSALVAASISIGLLWACLHTIQSHANILSNLFGSLQVFLNLLTGDSTHKYQKIGLLMVILGATLMIWDPYASRVNKNVETQGAGFWN